MTMTTVSLPEFVVSGKSRAVRSAFLILLALWGVLIPQNASAQCARDTAVIGYYTAKSYFGVPGCDGVEARDKEIREVCRVALGAVSRAYVTYNGLLVGTFRSPGNNTHCRFVSPDEPSNDKTVGNAKAMGNPANITNVNCGCVRTQCADGIDNDGDGAADFPNDFSCSSALDNDEGNPRSQCQDGADNDGDGLSDQQDPGCSSNQDNNEGDKTSQCQDGIDNDGDGATDFPNDFSCSSRTDNDETNPKSQCQDGVDNDNDGLSDLNDPGCQNTQGNNEGSATAQCQDGIDNDGDGATDFPADFSCTSRTDNDETNAKAQCQDGIDNDGDGLMDQVDPGCASRQDNNEGDGTSQCQDGIDNDGDGANDFPADFSCSSPQDTDETNPKSQCQDGSDNDSDGLTDTNDPGCSSGQDNTEGDGTSQCQDGIDNDGDGATDFPADFSCSSATDNDERNPKSQCQDGVDNDNDGLTDLDDPGCANGQGNNEGSATAQCQDGIDNDNDGAKDFPQDFSCSSAQDKDEGNPKSQCQDGIDNDADGAADFPADFGCSSSQDNDEGGANAACQDGVDNDLDGLTDLQDPGCTGPQDNNEGDESLRLAVGVECVMDNADGSKTAYFSYNNATAEFLDLPIGSAGSPTVENRFKDVAPDQGQPRVFVPGLQRGIVAVKFSSQTVTWSVRAPRSASSQAVASAGSPQCPKVNPSFECKGFESGKLVARASYNNPNPFVVSLPQGGLNFFAPVPAARGQVTNFLPGLNVNAFSVEISPSDNITSWILDGVKASVDNSTPVCSGQCVDTPVGAIRGELDSLAVQIAEVTKEAADVLANVDDGSGKPNVTSRRTRRRALEQARSSVDAERARAKADSYVAQSKALTIEFPDVVKNCPEAPLYCETVDRGATIDQLRALFAEARNTATRVIARAYYRQTGSTNRRDALVRRAKNLEQRGLSRLSDLPRTETVCK